MCRYVVFCGLLGGEERISDGRRINCALVAEGVGQWLFRHHSHRGYVSILLGKLQLQNLYKDHLVKSAKS